MLRLFNPLLFQLNLVTNCSMDWTMQDSIESLMSVCSFPLDTKLTLGVGVNMFSYKHTLLSVKVKTKELKNCTKEMVLEYHDKTIYDCKNVTKRHCTTL